MSYDYAKRWGTQPALTAATATPSAQVTTGEPASVAAAVDAFPECRCVDCLNFDRVGQRCPVLPGCVGWLHVWGDEGCREFRSPERWHYCSGYAARSARSSRE
jgi:hypothetical protein